MSPWGKSIIVSMIPMSVGMAMGEVLRSRRPARVARCRLVVPEPVARDGSGRDEKAGGTRSGRNKKRRNENRRNEERTE
jgi:hypothetical protein